MNREDSIENIKKIRKLIANAEYMDDLKFRTILEQLIKNGDDNSLYVVIKYMKSIEIGVNQRLNIIRAVGYLSMPIFLEPLKKLVETENNIHIKKEAIISIAKFNDRRALNILNNALKDLRNSILLQTINNEIGKIKKNNPILTLMPRFINEKDNYKSFRVTIDILKRILNDKDASLFIKFLTHPESKVKDAAFEILCSVGSIKINENIYNFFYGRSIEIKCIESPECEELFSLTISFYTYLERFPELIINQLSDLEKLFNLVEDFRIREKIIEIISMYKDISTVEILKEFFNNFKQFRNTIVYHLGRNPDSFDFLFEVYKSKSLDFREIILPLMMMDRGIKYFYDHFEEKEYEEQEVILKEFPFNSNPYYIDFCKNILNSNHYNLKILLLNKIREKGEFSVKDTLLNSENQKEFFLMEKEYVSTILKLFPVSAVKKILDAIVFEEFSVTKTKRFFKELEPVLNQEIVFDFGENPILNYLSNKIVNMNNTELNLIFLSIFSNFKVINPRSFNDLNIALNIFLNQRGSKINIKEKYEVRKIKENLTNLSIVKRKIENLERILKIHKSSEDFSTDKFESIIKENSMSVPFFIDKILELIKKHFLNSDFTKIPSWIKFFNTFPQIANRLSDTILHKTKDFNPMISKDLLKVYSNVQDKTRIILRFTEKDNIAIILDQFNEIIHDIEIIHGDTIINRSDILLCDGESFKNIIKKGDMPTKYTFLFLNKISEFVEYKSFNPRFFVKPYSFFRILRDILKELYLIKYIPSDKEE